MQIFALTDSVKCLAIKQQLLQVKTIEQTSFYPFSVGDRCTASVLGMCPIKMLFKNKMIAKVVAEGKTW